MDFKPFPKLARLNREIVITEKLVPKGLVKAA